MGGMVETTAIAVERGVLLDKKVCHVERTCKRAADAVQFTRPWFGKNVVRPCSNNTVRACNLVHGWRFGGGFVQNATVSRCLEEGMDGSRSRGFGAGMSGG